MATVLTVCPFSVSPHLLRTQSVPGAARPGYGRGPPTAAHAALAEAVTPGWPLPPEVPPANVSLPSLPLRLRNKSWTTLRGSAGHHGRRRKLPFRFWPQIRPVGSDDTVI